MPFKKGQSANPGGRPKHKAFADALRMEIAAAGADSKKLRQIAKTLIKKAEKGDMAAIREVADRLDGKPAQALEIDNNPHREITDFSDDDLKAILRSHGHEPAKKPEKSNRSNKLH